MARWKFRPSRPSGIGRTPFDPFRGKHLAVSDADVLFGRFVVEQVGNDALVCSDKHGKSVLVAKPWWFRKSSWDGETIDGVTYTSSSLDVRTTDGGVTETLTPGYAVGEELLAVRAAPPAVLNVAVGELSGVAEGDYSIEWEDLNTAGKVWDVAAAGFQWYQITAFRADYLLCETWDGAILGGTTIYVAKPPTLRESSWDGVTYDSIDYASTSGSARRTADYFGDVALQTILPMWFKNADAGRPLEHKLILAASVPFTGVTVLASDDPTEPEIVWQDLGLDGRAYIYEHSDDALWGGTYTQL